MKLTKNASGKTILKLNKSDWQKIGKQAGWVKHSAGTSWKNRPGVFQLEIDIHNGIWVDTGGKPLPGSVQEELNAVAASGRNPTDLMINFESSGEDNPATWEDPAEGYDERVIQNVQIEEAESRDHRGLVLKPSENIGQLSEGAASELEDQYREQMAEIEINTEPPEPEYDAEEEYDRRKRQQR